MAEEIKEGSNGYLEVFLLNKDGDPTIPSAVTYRIDCLTTGVVIRDTTEIIELGSMINITLEPVDTTIVDQQNEKEERLITIEADSGPDGQINTEFRYDVINLYGVARPSA